MTALNISMELGVISDDKDYYSLIHCKIDVYKKINYDM